MRIGLDSSPNGIRSLRDAGKVSSERRKLNYARFAVSRDMRQGRATIWRDDLQGVRCRPLNEVPRCFPQDVILIPEAAWSRDEVTTVESVGNGRVPGEIRSRRNDSMNAQNGNFWKDGLEVPESSGRGRRDLGVRRFGSPVNA